MHTKAKKPKSARKRKSKRKVSRKKPKPAVVQLVGERVGKKVKVTALHESQTLFIDTIDLNSGPQRQRFIRGVRMHLTNVDVAGLDTKLITLPDTLPAEVQPETESTGEAVATPVRAVLTYTPSSNGRAGAVAADIDGETVHLDNSVDPLNAQHRARFIKALAKKCPNLDQTDSEAQLLDIAEQLHVQPARVPTGDRAELDISRVMRPELFITSEVTGIAVPKLVEIGGKPVGRWVLYLRWSNGRRERSEMATTIDLSAGGKLWIHPQPSEPTPSTARALCGWSAQARQTWLQTAERPDPADLFKRLCERIAYFIDLPREHAAGTTATLALWMLLTYCYPAWDAVPYLYVGGPLGSGKSRVFEILLRVVFRALASSNLTGPTLFRTLHNQGGTLLFDEAERLKQTQRPEVGEIMSMLLAGYKRGGQATRLEPVGDTFKTVTFDVYGPKALASIAVLPPVLSSRCIPVMMFRAAPDSPKPRRRIDADPSGWQCLRDDLHALALNHGPVWLDLAKREGVCPPMSGRDYELWQPLMALAGWIESEGARGLLKVVQDHAKATIDAGKDEQTSDADETLLRIIADAWRLGQRLTPGEVLAKAQESESEMFKRWFPRTVTARLKTYGIPTPRKSGSRREFRDVTLNILRRIQRNYGIDLDLEDDQTDGMTTPGRPSQASQASQPFPDSVPQGAGIGTVGTVGTEASG